MPKETLVSIILPFWNSAAFIGKAIQSIVDQTHENWELILVENNSTDESLPIAAEYVSKDSRIRMYNHSGNGVASAFNFGFMKSRGRIIARMDSDDISDPKRIETQLKLLAANSYKSIVYSKVKPLGDPTIGWLRYLVWQNSILEPDQIYKNRFVEMPVCNPTLMASRKTVSLLGLYDENIYPEDYDFFLRACSMNIPITKTLEPLLFWRDHKDRLTRAHEGYSRENFYEVKARYLYKYLSKVNPNHPYISIWGTGKMARRYIDILENEGFKFHRFFDLKGGDFKKGKIESFEKIKKGKFLVSLVGSRGADLKIEKFLAEQNFISGVDFILTA